MAAQLGGQPVLILKEDTKRTVGRDAQRMNIMAARVISEAVKSTLGPRGMDKMLVDSLGDVVVTNDGVTILKEMDIEHPAAKMIVEISKTQENEVGDGTTTAAILGGELLKKAEGLIEQEIHATIVAKGYRNAAEKAVEILNSVSFDISPEDKATLKKVAKMAMIGKGAEKAKELLAELVVSALISVAEKENGRFSVDKEHVKLEKKEGGGIEDTSLIKGVIIDKERAHKAMPKKVKGAKIVLINSALEVKKTEVDAKVRITDPSQLHAFVEEEEHMIKEMVGKIKSAGANVLLSQKAIDDLGEHYLAKEGVFAVKSIKKSDMEKLSRATGARIVTNLDDLSKSDLGAAGVVEEVKIGDDEMVFVQDCKNPKSVSILVRGGTEHIVDEAERAIEDAVGVVAAAIEDCKLVADGGGAPEVEVAKELRKYAKTIGGREQLAVEAFADALEVVPRALAENAGMDPVDVIVELRAAHEKKGGVSMGLDVFSGKVVDMKKKGLVAPLRLKTQVIESASEVAVMILRIDDVISAKGGGAGGGVGEE